MPHDGANELIAELSRIARRGPLPGIGSGPPSVGMTLLRELGIDYLSTKKPRKNGVVVTARRGTKNLDPNRVNLFAMVPDWGASTLKSSAEIVAKYGYPKDGVRKLNCTVRAKLPNPQGLYLLVDRAKQELQEWADVDGHKDHVASWSLEKLRNRLADSHPETIWVTARAVTINGQDHFHYRYAVYSSAARVEVIPELIMEGTITMDHLITDSAPRVIEKGPLFKIHPRNLPLLFPETRSYDLLSM